jgi:hypothetical protein
MLPQAALRLFLIDHKRLHSYRPPEAVFAPAGWNGAICRSVNVYLPVEARDPGGRPRPSSAPKAPVPGPRAALRLRPWLRPIPLLANTAAVQTNAAPGPRRPSPLMIEPNG